MYVPFSCSKCKDQGYTLDQSRVLVLYRDDGIYNIECRRGHKFVGTFQSHLHQILFEIGAYAILDGYYREAVASFASALERFFEFYIKVIAISKKIKNDEYKKVWKRVAAQSERQFGAFVFVYLLVNDKDPNLPTEVFRSFRNSVIHKGKIPSKEEAIEYGNCVKNTIEDLTLELYEHDQFAVTQVMKDFLEDARKKIGDRYDASVAISTILGISKGEISNWGRPSLEEHLDRIQQVRQDWFDKQRN